MKIVSGSSNHPLAKNIARKLNTNLVETEIKKFANGEKHVWIKEDVRSQNVALIQSFSNPVDEHVIETLLIIDALERSGVRHINLIIPWMGYSLQDKVFRPGEPISAKVIADMISNAYVKRVFLLDLHNNSIPGFFSIPTEYLSSNSLFIEYIQTNFSQDDIIVGSPDFGGLKRARDFAEKLGTDLVNIDKHRDLQTGQVTAVDLHGNVENKTVFFFDDVIVSGGTVIEASRLMKERGAQAVHFIATHGLFVNDAINKLNTSEVDSVIVTNSLLQTQTTDKLKIVDVSNIFVDSLKNWI